MTKRLGLLLALVPGVLAACAADSSTSVGGGTEDLRGLTREEVLADLNVMGDTIHAFYGPLQFKQARFGFDIDKELTKARSAVSKGKTEADRVRALYDLLAKLQDGHVSLQWQLQGDASADYNLPFVVTPVEGSYLAVAVGGGLAIKRGDELVSIDGNTTKQMEDLIRKSDDIGTPESTLHDLGFRMTQRPFYENVALVPTAATAHVVLHHADGSEYALDIPWGKTPGGLAGQLIAQVPAPVAPAPSTQPSSVAPGATPAASDPTTSHGTFSSHTAFVLKRIKELDQQGSSILQLGSIAPWYLTSPVRAAIAPVEVTPTPDSLKKYAVEMPDPAQDPKAADFIHLKAWKYKHNGKVVLLVRIPEFETPHGNNFDDQISWLAGLLEENLAGGKGDAAVAAATPAGGAAVDTSFVSTPADVLVVDDTANPGGTISYALGLASLLITKPIPSLVQRQHADRKWIKQYVTVANHYHGIAGAPTELGDAFVGYSQTVEKAFDANQWLSDFIPFSGRNTGNTADLELEDLTGGIMLSPHPQVNWAKPLLVLHDELSGSCGDFFPDLLQNSGVPTFGARTMGLGGSVEEIATLPNSGAILSLTRGMGGPYNADPNAIKLIENEGVTPTIPQAVTKADFRAGFTGWVNAFSDAAVTLVK